jgi:DNA-directed RNA polymerase specialized sigma24 family protein
MDSQAGAQTDTSNSLSPADQVRAYVANAKYVQVAKFLVTKYPRLFQSKSEDFQQMLAVRLLEKAHLYDPRKSPQLSAWVAAIARNLFIDIARRAGASPENQRHVSAQEGDHIPADAPSETLVPDDYRFDAEDLSLMTTAMQADNRVIMLAANGCNRFVPEATWSQWLAQADFPPDFPGQNFWQTESLQGRNQILSDLTGKSINTLSQIKSRGAKLLKKTSLARHF